MPVDKPARPWYSAGKGAYMDLALLPTSLRGRAGHSPSPEPEFVRELAPADLSLLSGPRGSRPSPLKRLADRHHQLARLLAGGEKEGVAAMAVGLDGARVSNLKADPLFQELLEYYRGQVNEVYRDLHSHLAAIAIDAAEEIRTRLEENGEKIPLDKLTELVKMGADRTGFGPATKSTQMNIHVDLAARLESARARVAERRQLTIEVEKS